MNNQEFLITLLVITLFIFKFFNNTENFETNDYPCILYPTNSNCSCPPDANTQRILGDFPMNYSKKSPYLYSCVSPNIKEPDTNLYPNPPE
jgi:hypothetical protein